MLERNSYMNKDKDKNGKIMYSWAKDLYPMCRSITGDGVRKTLAYFNKLLPYDKIRVSLTESYVEQPSIMDGPESGLQMISEFKNAL